MEKVIKLRKNYVYWHWNHTYGRMAIGNDKEMEEALKSGFKIFRKDMKGNPEMLNYSTGRFIPEKTTGDFCPLTRRI